MKYNINLYQEFEEWLNEFKNEYNKIDLEVINNLKEDIMIRYDKKLLLSLFNHIFENAIKYNNGKIKVKLDAEIDITDITISIKDNGIGLTDEQIEHVFEEFYKADESRHDLDSSGLGLSICKLIVEKHGGKIWAKSPGLNKGSTFFFSIPRVLNDETDEILVSINS
jgi:signal transduction histidine kinase